MSTSRAILVFFLVVAAFAGGYGYGRWYGKESSTEPQQKGGRRILYYHDPMHPAYKSDKPGIAPDCGMKLEPVYAGEGAVAPAANRKILHYRDPHDPAYTSDKPGLNPETGNDLEPVYADDSASGKPGTVQISPQKQQLIGVRYGQAEYTNGGEVIRAVGKVTADERLITHVHSRTEGFIEKVFVNFTGDLVEKGQPLLTIYSPELLATQQEYLLALKARQIMNSSTVRGAVEDSDSLVEAARRRLELWDLSPAQIESVRETGKPLTNITLFAPASGIVTARNAFPNQKVGPDTELYTVVDLSRIWVLANVFEYEAPLVRVGQAAVVTVPYEGGKSYRARVSYIQPQVDAGTRTLQVRLELANSGLKLKPEMFVDVELAGSQHRSLTVPAEAVLDSGLEKTVFVDAGNGFFEPRKVETGRLLVDRVEILKGLKAGERIVTSGNFLINSESQMKAAASGMGAGGQETAAPPGGAQKHD
jgi:RND family efflux transporter MFP subunit